MWFSIPGSGVLHWGDDTIVPPIKVYHRPMVVAAASITSPRLSSATRTTPTCCVSLLTTRRTWRMPIHTSHPDPSRIRSTSRPSGQSDLDRRRWTYRHLSGAEMLLPLGRLKRNYFAAVRRTWNPSTWPHTDRAAAASARPEVRQSWIDRGDLRTIKFNISSSTTGSGLSFPCKDKTRSLRCHAQNDGNVSIKWCSGRSSFSSSCSSRNKTDRAIVEAIGGRLEHPTYRPSRSSLVRAVGRTIRRTT